MLSTLHAAKFNTTFYSGRAVSVEGQVPGFYEVAIDGTPYLIDWKTDSVLQYQFRYKHETAEIVRQQGDSSTQPGEHSLSPDNLWRRSAESWHGGAGQSYFDRAESSPFRFRDSHGIDVWTKWQFSLLPVASQASSASSPTTNAILAVAGDRLYCATGQIVQYTTDLTTWTTVAGTPASTVQSMTSDGYHVYAMYGTGICRITAGVGTNAWCPQNGTIVRYANGHLYIGNGPTIYDVDGTGTATSLGYNALSSAFTMVDATAGHSVSYIAANVGDQGLILRANLDTNVGTTSLMVVAELPRGETVSAIQEYLGLMLVGTSRGWRLGTPTGQNPSSGYIALGALVKTEYPVMDFETHGQYAWFTTSNTSATETGTGRIDLTTINLGGVPAYANDVTVEGLYVQCQSIVQFREKLVWGVQAAAGVKSVYSAQLFYDKANFPDTSLIVKRAMGWIDSGDITYGLPDTKVVVAIDIRHKEFVGDEDHSCSISTNGSAFVNLGMHGISQVDLGVGTVGGVTLTTNEAFGDRIEVRHTLMLGTDLTRSVVMTRSTLKSVPRVGTVLQIQVPLILAREEEIDTAIRPRDPDALYASLLTLRASQRPITYQERATAYTVIVSDVILFPAAFELQGKKLAGTVVVRLKTLDI